jgi:hypothetical protein
MAKGSGSTTSTVQQAPAVTGTWTGGVKLQLLTPGSTKYQQVEHQFMKKWLHPKSTNPMKAVSLILAVETPSLHKRFQAYQSQVAAKGVPVFGNGGPGNTQRRFHGTRLACDLGRGNMSPCSSGSCIVCCIIQNGFQVNRATAERYGDGIYLSATSSKAGDYNKGTKCVLLCSVVVGKGFKMTDEKWVKGNIIPSGYDSILGEVGNALNYDEVVVPVPEAVYPHYIIRYT